jgi:hypothetical protein
MAGPKCLTNMTIVPRSRRRLKTAAEAVDSDRMSATEANFATFEHNCLTVLECYAVRDAAAKTANSEYSGWLDRMIDVPGIDPSLLTSIHGFLIAQGLIRFEFTGRSVGLQYQLSTSGRDAISRRSLCLADESRIVDGSSESLAEEKTQAA